MSKIVNILKAEITEKLKNLPFGYGEEEGCEGFPKWCVYVDSNGKLHGKESLQFSFNDKLTPLDNIMNMPINQICLLLENGLSGDKLFKEINDNYVLRNGMCYQANQDAELWQENKSTKLKF